MARRVAPEPVEMLILPEIVVKFSMSLNDCFGPHKSMNRYARLTAFLLASVLLFGASLRGQNQQAARQCASHDGHAHGPEPTLAHSRVQPVSASMPALRFVENKGQWHANVRYRLKVGPATVFVERNRLRYLVFNGEQLAQLHPADPAKLPFKHLDAHVYDMEFRGANLTPALEAQEPNGFRENFLQGDDPSRWVSGARSFQAVQYNDLYPGVDLKLYGNGSTLEYDFILQPKADAAQIRLDYPGVDGRWVDAKGFLHLQTTVGEIVEQIPLAYQMQGQEMKPVACRFRQGSDGSVGFDFPQGYDRSAPLIIDPILVFSTMTGSRDDNWGMTATFDAAGALYSGGIVNDTDGSPSGGYPTTTGAYQVRFAGGGDPGQGNSLWYESDMAIVKYSPDGSRIEYATYLGGQDNEQPHSIITNAQGELYIMGTTRSPNFPTTEGAYQRQLRGGWGDIDMVVCRLSADGTRLLGSTFVGGTSDDGVNRIFDNPLYYFYADDGRGDIYLDAQGAAYVISSTNSSDFPTTAGALDRNLGGEQDAVALKLTGDMRTLVWSTFVGGSGMDAGYSIEADAAGHLVIAGGTSSRDLPGTGQGWNVNAPGGDADGFVFRLHRDGGAIINGTYVGTNQYDQVYFVEMDVAGNVYIAGQTTGDYPAQGTAYNVARGKQFVTKLSPDLRSVIYSFRFGSGLANRPRPDITPTAFLIDDCENIYVAGWGSAAQNLSPVGQQGIGSGNNSEMPITSDAVQRTTNRSGFYLMCVIRDGQRLHYGTYFGGARADDHVDGGTSRFDKRGVVYHSVCANCKLGRPIPDTDFPTTEGAWSRRNLSENCNNGSFKFDFQESPDAQFVPPAEGCAPLTVNFQNATRNGQVFQWDFGDGSQGSVQVNPSHTYTRAGTYRIRLIAQNQNSICHGVDTTYQEVVVREQSDARFTAQVDSCTGQVRLSNQSTGQNYRWRIGNQTSQVFEPPVFTVQRGQSITIHLTADPNTSCADSMSLTVSVPAPVSPDFTTDQPGCGLTLACRDRSTAPPDRPRLWLFGDGNSSTLQSPTHTYERPGTYRVTLIINPGSPCPDSLSREVIMEPGPTAGLRVAPIQCSRLVVPVNESVNATSFEWNFGDGSPPRTGDQPEYTYLAAGTYTVRIVAIGKNNCRDSSEAQVRIVDPARADFVANVTRCNPVVSLSNRSDRADDYYWELGNGQTSTNPDVGSVQFASPGAYSIRLTVNRETPCPATRERVVQVTFKAEAAIEVVPEICTRTRNFTSQSRYTQTYRWSFGDGQGQSSLQNPSYTYGAQGTYRVTFIANPEDPACADTAALDVQVPILPRAAFLPEYVPCTYELRFRNLSVDASRFLWDFGPGTGQPNAAEPNAVFPGPGQYRVRLTAEPNSDCPDVAEMNLVLDTLPEVRALNDTLACSLDVRFRAQAAGVSTLTWDFGDGIRSTVNNPTHTYAGTGRYFVTLIGRREGNGCADTANLNLYIPHLAQADFLPRYVPCSYEVEFQNRSREATDYVWDLGAAGRRTDFEPDATFPGPGSYRVSLVANPDSLCPDTLTMQLRLDTLPTVSGTVEPFGCSRDVPFRGTAAGVDELLWQFGDGAESQQLSPTHSYPVSGRFTALLIGRRAGNACADTARVPVIIPNLPRASFLPEYVPCTYRVRLRNTSAQAATYLWDDGRGNLRTEESPVIDFGGPGRYRVRLVADPDSLCPDTREINLQLDTLPAAEAQALPVECSPTVDFRGTISGITDWRWEMGDGTTVTSDLNHRHTYPAPGTYTARLIGTRGGGACVDTSEVQITVPVLPVADFLPQYDPCTYSVRLVNRSRQASAYLWDLGALGTQTTTDAAITFPGPGSYEVTLIADPEADCPDVMTIQLRLAPIPVAAAIATPVDCSPTVQFGGQIEGGDEIYWDFGDGNTARDIRNPIHTYAEPGIYTARVTLIRRGDACRAESEVTVEVPALPRASFTAEKLSCSYRVRLSNQSVFSQNYLWNYGFGAETTVAEPGIIEFPRPGTYEISLTVEPNSSCPNAMTQIIVLDSLPDVDISYEREPCSNEVRFRATGTQTDEQTWTFGDGASRRNQMAPVYTYPAPGSYTVRLIGVRSGCADTAQVALTVPALPRADFRADWSPCRSEVTLTSRSTGATELLWETGDGNVYEDLTTVRHTYATAGSFEIRLTAISANGCVDQRTQRIQLSRLPTAVFTLTNAACSPSIDLSNASQNASEYLWLFGDGRTSTRSDAQFTHTYSAAGSYSVRLIARTAQGCADTAQQNVTIHLETAPRFRVDTAMCSNAVRTVNQTTGGSSFFWDFGDGSTSAERQPNYSYAGPGTYKVKLTAGPDLPCPRTDSTQITITAPRQASFTANVPACSDRLQITNGSEAPHFGLRWEFGDGNASADAQPTHRYAEAGTYTVLLILDGNSACERTATQTVRVESVPVADFTAQTPPCAGDLTLVNDSRRASRYSWSFGDGAVSDRPLPTHRYTAAGEYTVRLIAEGTGGCRDTMERTVTVRLPSTAAFSLQIDTCRLSVSLEARTQNATRWTWNLGDNTLTDNDAPRLTHAYARAGRYTITLTTEPGTACEHRASQTFELPELPEAAFSHQREPCQLPVQFQQLCRNAVQFSWDFGDGNTSSEENPRHVYETGGAYTVNLTAYSAAGCTDLFTENVRVSTNPEGTWDVPAQLCSNELTVTADYGDGVQYAWYVNDTVRGTTATLRHLLGGMGVHRLRLRVSGEIPCFAERETTVEVMPSPEADFEVTQEPCSPDVFLRDRSQGAARIAWRLSDGATSTESIWEHSFPQAGAYTVWLTAFTEAGCADSVMQEIRVGPAESAEIEATLDPCVFTAMLEGVTSAGQTFTWEAGDGTQLTGNPVQHRYAQPGTYTARLTVDAGTPCETTAERTFSFGDLPKASFGARANLCGGYLDLTNASTFGYRYQWLLPDGSTSEATNPKFPLGRNQAFDVRLVAFNEWGCSDTTSLHYVLGNEDLDRLSLPNVFTPNGDGLNEVFVLPGEYWGCIEQIMIFDRWGNKIFESKDLKISWDGRFEGELVPEGAYVMVVEIDGLKYVGTVTVLR